MTRFDDMTQPQTDNQQTDKLHDHHRQQLSAMLDGELRPDQAKFMLRRLEHDAELAACWERWQVCGDILRGRHEGLLPADFSRRVAAAIGGQDAAATAASARAPAKHPRWVRWGGGAALAASVAVVALFVGRQAPELEVGPAAPEQAPMVASATAPETATMPAPATPDPVPAAPAQAPDAATTLAAAVAVAELPRRAAERRSSRTQRAAARNRRAAEAPVLVAAGGRAAIDPMAHPATPAALVAGLAAADAPEATITDLFSVESVHPRPWPRAILPDFPARDAFTASYGAIVPEQHPFHPFEPRVELQPASAERPQPGASGPR